MSVGGRPKSDIYDRLKFDLIRGEGNKCAAFCMVCKKLLKNTSHARLMAHRNICNMDEQPSGFQPERKKTAKDTPKKTTGRPRGDAFTTLKFEFKKHENGRSSAICTLCDKELKSTAGSRLLCHRNLCKTDDMDADMEALRLTLETQAENKSPRLGFSKRFGASSSKPGRPRGGALELLKFDFKKGDNGRSSAICLLCGVELKSTAGKRLLMHRKTCKTDEMEENIQMLQQTIESPVTPRNEKRLRPSPHKPGRPRSKVYDELHYELINTEGKCRALCLVCGKLMANTSVARLEAHRNICKSDGVQIRARQMEICPTTVMKAELESSSSDMSDADPYGDMGMTYSDTEIDLDAMMTMETTPTITVNANPLSMREAKVKFEFIDLPPEEENCNMDVFYPTSDDDHHRAPSSSAFQITPVTSTHQGYPHSSHHHATKSEVSAKFSNTLSEKDEKDITTAIANFFYGCNIPLSVIESDLFKNLITRLRPTYSKRLPKKEALSTILLNTAYENCLKKTAKLLSSDAVLLIDGWEDNISTTKTIVCTLRSDNGKMTFLKSCHLMDPYLSEERLSEIVQECIELAREQYQTSIYATVSTRPAADIGIWYSSCSTNAANLLAKEILNSQCTNAILAVLDRFKNTDLETSLIEKGGSPIRILYDSKLSSYHESLECFLKNVDNLRLVATEAVLKIDQIIFTAIFDDILVEQVKENLAITKPICALMSAVEKSTTSAADAVDLWLNLMLPERFADNLNASRLGVFNKYALSAYYLHPNYDNGKLTLTQIDEAQTFLFEQLNAEGIEDWHYFKEKTGLFGTLLDKGVAKNPSVFWSMAKLKHPVLSKVAIKLLNIPASSANIERNFANRSYVHTSMRSGLSLERAKKLLHVYYFHKIDDRNESDEY